MPQLSVKRPVVHEPPPIEVHGMGTVQKIRDELYYLENKMEAVTHSNHRVEDALTRLSDELGSFVGILEEIRDILLSEKKKTDKDDDG